MIRIFILILSVLFLLGPSPAAAEAEAAYRQGQATAHEVLLLPSFCRWEYSANFKNTGEINNCGVGINHYCPAVLEFNRSYSTREQFRRVQHLEVALRGVEYTLGWMKDSPNCSIRQHVLQTYTRVRSAFVGVGRPIPPDRFSSQWASPAKPYTSGNSSTKSEERQTEENNKTPEPMQEEGSKQADPAAEPFPAVEKDTISGATPSSTNVQPSDSTKIGTPSNPYCRFCPPE